MRKIRKKSEDMKIEETDKNFDEAQEVGGKILLSQLQCYNYACSST